MIRDGLIIFVGMWLLFTVLFGMKYEVDGVPHVLQIQGYPR